MPTLDTVTPDLLAALTAREAQQQTTLTAAEAEFVRRAEEGIGLSTLDIRKAQRKQQQAALARLQREMVLRLFPSPPRYFGRPVRIGFDSEYVTLPVEGGGWRNEVLCVTAVLQCGGRTSRYIFYPKGPSRDDRLTIPSFVQAVLRKAMLEGVISSMPDEVIVFGHFIRADLPSFQDFWRRKREFRGLGKTLVSGRGGHVVPIKWHQVEEEHALGEEDEVTSRDMRVALRDLAGYRFQIRVRFIDTIKLTPGQKGLDYVGAMNGIAKLDLHEDLGIPRTATVERPECVGMGLPARYGKDRMDLVMRDFPEETEKYAFRDADLTLDHGLKMEQYALQDLGLRHLPNTLAACAAGVVQRLAGGPRNLSALLGRMTSERAIFNEKTRTFRTVKRDVSSPGLDMYYTFASNCYHGGRNECFYHGPTDVGVWYDYDLSGAYSTVMAALRPVDHARGREELDPDAYGIDDMGLAWITFEFPPGTRFPCIPVRGSSDALFFPLSGSEADQVYVASPEIFLARRLGARVTIIQGKKWPWKSETRVFESFTRLVQTKRREFPKSTHRALNELWKEIGNSAYGLTAQGIKEKNVFDPATMASQKIGPSQLTEPFFAAWITSFMRAVLGEILAGVPGEGRVVSATTDGLLTDVPIERLRLDGPLCSYYAEIRERLFGAREVLDPQPKHAARQIVSVAVRTTFTAVQLPGYQLVCAKGSVRPPTRSDPAAENRYMLKLYLGQEFGKKIPHEQLMSAREQLTREADLRNIKRERIHHLRFDFKRRAVRPRMVQLGRRTERVAWDTEPWPSLAQAEFARSRVDGWARARKRVVKTLDDFRHLESFVEASWAVAQACAAVGVRALQVRHDNAQGLLKRAFLQAGRHGKWGVKFGRGEITAAANALTAAGYETTKEDITYAGRRSAPLVEHHVPWLPETRALLRVILELYPHFQFLKAFAGPDPSAPVAAPPNAPSSTEASVPHAAEKQ